MQQVLLLSGSEDSDISEVASALCERFDKMLLVHVADMNQFVRAGLQEIGDTSTSAIEQKILRIKNSISIAANAIDMRYGVIIVDDLDEMSLEIYKTECRKENVAPVHIIFLDQSNSAIGSSQLAGHVLEYESDSNPYQKADRIQKIIGTNPSTCAFNFFHLTVSFFPCFCIAFRLVSNKINIIETVRLKHQ